MKVGEASYAIIGVVPYVDFHPALALPIVESTDLPGCFFIQIMSETSQEIVDFYPLTDFSPKDLAAQTSIPIRIGDHYKHAFIDRNRELHIDSLSALSSILINHITRSDTPTSTKISIADQLGDSERAYKIRHEFSAAISDNFGQESANSYLNSAVRTRLWDILIGNAKNKESKGRIRHSLARTDGRINSTGVEIDISAVDIERDLTVSAEQILNQLNIEFRNISLLSPKPQRVDLSGFGVDPSSDQILLAIQRSPRQEERLAVLLRALLVHPASGLSALRRYEDNARFAQSSVRLLRQHINENIPESHRELAIAKLLPKLFADVYPLRKGDLLYYLAAHLSDFKNIRGTIRNTLAKSANMSVERYRTEIAHQLHVAEKSD